MEAKVLTIQAESGAFRSLGQHPGTRPGPAEAMDVRKWPWLTVAAIDRHDSYPGGELPKFVS
jgi:hypothetical protein